MGKKIIEKKTFSLEDFKKNNGFDNDVKDKDLEFITLSKAFYEATGLPGIIKGITNLSRGFSNTGKSTGLYEAMVSAQKNNILPIFIDTENNFNWAHAKDIGLEFEEVIDENTGEVINYNGFFIYINNDYLIETYGKKRDKNRQEAVIEDIGHFIDDILNKQSKEELPFELLFLWDSIGSVDCEQCVTSKTRNNMWNAGSLETTFKSLLNHRIPSSRKENKPYTNTIYAVQKIWLDSMQGAGVVKHKGGEAFFYGARLIIHHGGILTHGTTKISAQMNSKEYILGTEAKIEIVKNQINGVSKKGKLISTAHGFILPEEKNEYAKKYKEFILSKLGEKSGEFTLKEEVVKGIDKE